MIKLNGGVVAFPKFPVGESMLAKSIFNNISVEDRNTIMFKFQSNEDLIHLMLLKGELDTIGVKNIRLVIMYMPYSRMDRANSEYAFSLQYVCKFLDHLQFPEIVLMEPHSGTSQCLLDNCSVLDVTVPLFNQTVLEGYVEFDPAHDYVCYPDAGAVSNFEKRLNFPHIVGKKLRNFLTGKILKQELALGEHDIKGANVVILDDLCSAGGTFLGTAQLLKDLGANLVTLVVAHFEHVGLENLQNSPLIDMVVTTNSIIGYKDLAPYDKFCMYPMEDFIV